MPVGQMAKERFFSVRCPGALGFLHQALLDSSELVLLDSSTRCSKDVSELLQGGIRSLFTNELLPHTAASAFIEP